MRTIAIYHKDCTDGTTAAAVVLRKYPDALLFPLAHGYAPGEIEPILAEAKPGDRILTVDCVMGAKEFLAAGYMVTSIDHHASAEAESRALAAANPAYTFIFDNDKSGASGTWAYLFPDEPMPELIRHVEDYDLWRWKLEGTKYVANYMYVHSDDPKTVLGYFDRPIEEIKEHGRIMTEYSDHMIQQAVKDTEPIDVMIGGHAVPFYNITFNKSEGGNILSLDRRRAVGLFTIDSHFVKISFRSTDENEISALELAKTVGGGGHRNAAGAKMALRDFIDAIVHKE